MSSHVTRTAAASAQLKSEPFCYAVVDLASAQQLRPVIADQLPSVAEPLFAREFPRALLQVGPWLVRLSKAPEVERMLVEMGADLPWGYYVHSTFDIVSLRQSLRRFNLARLPDTQKEVLFRYWDPRVMRVFLDVATREQYRRLFELIEKLESPDGAFCAIAPNMDRSVC